MKKKLLAKFLTNPTQENRELHKSACRKVFDIFTDTRKAFMNNVLDETGSNTHDFYSLMKNGNKRGKNTPAVMTYKGDFVTGDKKLSSLALHLGDSFLKVRGMGDGSIEFESNLQKIYQENYKNEHEHLWTDFSLKTSISEVSRYIDELKINKDPGPMGITANFLKFNKDIIAPVITNCINSIFKTGNIPENWKECYITPNPKKGSVSEIENYRGIALQSCIPKIFDRIITRMLQENLNCVISPTQHGFTCLKLSMTTSLKIKST